MAEFDLDRGASVLRGENGKVRSDEDFISTEIWWALARC